MEKEELKKIYQDEFKKHCDEYIHAQNANDRSKTIFHHSQYKALEILMEGLNRV